MLKPKKSLLFLVFFISFIANAQSYKTKFTVALDGNADFTSIQQAIYACKAFPDERITIYIKNGEYKEKVRVPSWNNKLSLIGESKEKTIITFDDHFDKVNLGRNSTFYTYTLLIEANDFSAENLTIQNTAGPIGQAIALHVEGTRCQFTNCNILGNQDALYVAGENAKQYFQNCYIEGTTDFIFGEATALFEKCEIHSKADSYITAASTPQSVSFGLVFIQCHLTADDNVTKVYLGRPWRTHAKTVFIQCELGNHILPQGWDNWNNPEAEKLSFYAEYKSTDTGANPDQRVKWSHQLTSKQAAKYKKENIIGDIFKTMLDTTN